MEYVGIDELARQLPTPDDYFVGVTGALTTLPHTILAFSRTQTWLATEQQAFHHRFVLIVPLHGLGGVILDGRLYLLSPGQALLIFPYQSHYYTQLADAVLQWLFITYEYDVVEECASLRNQQLRLSAAAHQELAVILTTYLRRHQQPVGTELAVSLARLLAECLAQEHPDVTPHEFIDAKTALASQVCRYIYAQIAHPLTSADVAAAMSLSESHLRAVFRQTVGISLGAYIRQAKIFVASQRLRTTDRTVTDIATSCGYDSPFSFSRAFRQVMGYSPQQFRHICHSSRSR